MVHKKRIQQSAVARAALIAVLTAAISGQALSAGERPFLPGSARAAGMGNAWVASTAPEDALFFNPAFLATGEERFTAIRLRAAANSDGLGLLFGQDGQDIQNLNGEPIPADVAQRMSKFDAAYGHSGPLFLSYKGEGFGLGLFSSSHGEFVMHDGNAQTVAFQHDFDVGGIAGLAFKINLDREQGQQLLVGANFKYLIRVRHEAADLPLNEAAGLVDPFAFSGDFRIGQALGSDFAVAWKSPNLALGVVVYDWFGTTLSWTAYNGGFEETDAHFADTRINPSLGAGIAWMPDDLFGIPPHILSNVQFAVDVRGEFAKHSSLFKMVHAGFEGVLMHLVTLRMGVNAGHPAGGLGVVLFETLFLDYALSAEERPFFSRHNPLQIHTLSLSVVL
jgi:hypothetical protein